jgi:transketolase
MRIEILKMLNRAASGHTGGSLSATDIIAALYFRVMNHDARNPSWPERDRFVLSKGHGAPALYTALAFSGYFDKSELATLRQVGSVLQGHPDMRKTRGADASSGSLGQGLSIANGLALGLRLDGSSANVYVMLGDGELQEGQVWEAAMFAGSKHIPKLIAIVDYNKVQLSNKVDENLSLEPFAIKWIAFGWNVLSADGHNIADLLSVLSRASAMSARGPVVIIANTIKGKGVSFMEGKYEWHGKAPNDQEYTAAKKELGSK